MKISQYPAAIADAAQAISAIDQQIGEVRQEIAALEGKAEMVVAFETSLKNENQRKARRFEILEANQDHQQLQEQLLRLTTAKTNAIAHLEYVRNQFSVAKLEARWAIAEKLVGLESRELVGL
jgi:regulator of replication initiation timing